MPRRYSFENETDLDALAALALKELKRGHNPSDIIQHLCEWTGWDWRQAEQFLESVRDDNRSQLKAYKNRLFILVSLVMIADGMLNVAIFVVWVFYNPRSGRISLPDDMQSGIMTLFNQFFWVFAKFPIAYFFYSLALIGIGMIIGGVIGILRSFWHMIFK